MTWSPRFGDSSKLTSPKFNVLQAKKQRKLHGDTDGHERGQRGRACAGGLRSGQRQLNGLGSEALRPGRESRRPGAAGHRTLAQAAGNTQRCGRSAQQFLRKSNTHCQRIHLIPYCKEKEPICETPLGRPGKASAMDARRSVAARGLGRGGVNTSNTENVCTQLSA